MVKRLNSTKMLQVIFAFKKHPSEGPDPLLVYCGSNCVLAKARHNCFANYTSLASMFQLPWILLSLESGIQSQQHAPCDS